VTDSIFDKQRWHKFGHWLRDKRIVTTGSPARAGRLVGISGAQWQLIEQGLIHLDRETVICLAEAILADVREACRQAGYPPPEDYVHVPMLVRLLNALPPHIRADIATQVEALHQVYSDRTEARRQRTSNWYYASRELQKEMRKKLEKLEASKPLEVAEEPEGAEEYSAAIIELDDDNVA
jgi:hypothetical protein